MNRLDQSYLNFLVCFSKFVALKVLIIYFREACIIKKTFKFTNVKVRSAILHTLQKLLIRI